MAFESMALGCKNFCRVPKTFEFYHVAIWVLNKKGQVLSHFILHKSSFSGDLKVQFGQSRVELSPYIRRDNDPKMEGGQYIVLQAIIFVVKIEISRLGKGQLVAKKVNIQPFFGMSAQIGLDHILVKGACFLYVITWQGEVELCIHLFLIS